MTQTVRRPDADLARDVIDEVRRIPGIGSTHIGVAVNDGTGTLSGEVHSYPEMLPAGRAAQRIHGVTATPRRSPCAAPAAPGGTRPPADRAVT